MLNWLKRVWSRWFKRKPAPVVFPPTYNPPIARREYRIKTTHTRRTR